MIYHWFNLFGVAIEWICKLPCQHNHHIDGQQNSHDHKQLIVLDHFFVQFHVGEYRMNAPCLREHCTERQTKASHQQPCSSRANCSENEGKRLNSKNRINYFLCSMLPYGNAATLLKPLSKPRKMTLRYVHMQPTMIKLFRWGLDILIYLLLTTRKMLNESKSRMEGALHVPLIPILDVKNKKNCCHQNTQYRATCQNRIYR